MEDNGYLILVHDGWVVKKFAEGIIQKLEELANNSQKLILD
jgi:hypothetical protein